MRPVGSRKDHRFESWGQIKAFRGRGTNEERELIREQMLEESDEQKLLGLINAADKIYQSEADWEYKYDRIFGMSEPIGSLLEKLNLELRYYDPDTTYEEDVHAYVTALSDIKKNLESHL